MLEFCDRNVRANRPLFLAAHDLARAGQLFDVHEPARLRDVFLHFAEQVDAAGKKLSPGS